MWILSSLIKVSYLSTLQSSNIRNLNILLVGLEWVKIALKERSKPRVCVNVAKLEKHWMIVLIDVRKNEERNIFFSTKRDFVGLVQAYNTVSHLCCQNCQLTPGMHFSL